MYFEWEKTYHQAPHRTFSFHQSSSQCHRLLFLCEQPSRRQLWALRFGISSTIYLVPLKNKLIGLNVIWILFHVRRYITQRVRFSMACFLIVGRVLRMRWIKYFAHHFQHWSLYSITGQPIRKSPFLGWVVVMDHSVVLHPVSKVFIGDS